MQPHEITAEVMADVSVVMENDNLAPLTITQALVHTGRFLFYLTGKNPYNEIDPDSKEHWFVGHLGEFRFQEQLDSYLEYLKETKLTFHSIRQKRIHITICCRVLAKEKNIFFVSQIDESCYWHLEELMKDISTEVSNKILFDLNEFVKWCCGNDILKQFKKRRRPLKEYMESPEYADFMELVKAYRIDMEERGLRPKTVQSTIYQITEGYNAICDVLGPISPEQIDYHHFRTLRYALPELKQITIRLYLSHLGKMLDFFFGRNPYGNAGLVWSKESVDRTWIFKEDWIKLWNMADLQEKVVLALGGGMGLRRAEIAELHIEDIGEMMSIRGKGSGPNGKQIDKPIPPTVRSILDEYIHKNRAECIGELDPTEGNLLVMDSHRIGAPSTERHVETILQRLSVRSGIKFTAHTLRRYYCMTLLDAGVDLDVIRRMMRHENLETTLDCYIRADPRKIQNATSIIETAIFG